jgi:nucleotide-binding universal stress UspA family protein
MRALVCIAGREWEPVVRGAARYLTEGEAILAHVVDERGLTTGYDLATRGLLGRRTHRPQEEMATVSEIAARDLLADAEALLKQLCPSVVSNPLVLRGMPNEELIRAARDHGVETIFVGRAAPGAGQAIIKVSGVVRGWKRNHHGDLDALYLSDGTEVRFPPHRAPEILALAGEGVMIEAQGERRGRNLHAHRITDTASGVSVEAHKPPGGGPRKQHLGHTARFIVDHAPCDVVALWLHAS